MNSRSQAKHDLDRAKFAGVLSGILGALTGESNELVPFDWMRHLAPHGQHHLGLQTIPVDAVLGSVDRYHEFSSRFLPKEDHLDERWIAIRSLQLQGRELPPIQVYKVGELYFVKDGNHRVSVARRMGQAYMDAHVIELDVRVPPEAGDTLTDLIIKGEYAQFLGATRLAEVLPDHLPILFSTPGRYDILLDHIQKRQYFLGLNLGRDVRWEEAVDSWHGRLYGRVVDQIREHHVMALFPGRTEADLYLWIMEHRYFLTQEQGADPGSEVATLNFAEHHVPPLRVRVQGRVYQKLGGMLWRTWLRKNAARSPLPPG